MGGKGQKCHEQSLNNSVMLLLLLLQEWQCQHQRVLNSDILITCSAFRCPYMLCSACLTALLGLHAAHRV